MHEMYAFMHTREKINALQQSCLGSFSDVNPKIFLILKNPFVYWLGFVLVCGFSPGFLGTLFFYHAAYGFVWDRNDLPRLSLSLLCAYVIFCPIPPLFEAFCFRLSSSLVCRWHYSCLPPLCGGKSDICCPRCGRVPRVRKLRLCKLIEIGGLLFFCRCK